MTQYTLGKSIPLLIISVEINTFLYPKLNSLNDLFLSFCILSPWMVQDFIFSFCKILFKLSTSFLEFKNIKIDLSLTSSFFKKLNKFSIFSSPEVKR